MRIKAKEMILTVAIIAVLGVGIGFRPAPPQNKQVGTEKQIQAAKDLWTYITEKNDYKQWPLWPGEEGIREGESDRHGKFVRIFMNELVADDTSSLPDGSIIVKENFGAQSEDALGAITIMYRDTGYDPEHYDWFWIKYKPDGSLDQTPEGMSIVGRVPGCIQCHQAADGDDFVFANDK